MEQAALDLNAPLLFHRNTLARGSADSLPPAQLIPPSGHLFLGRAPGPLKADERPPYVDQENNDPEHPVVAFASALRRSWMSNGLVGGAALDLVLSVLLEAFFIVLTLRSVDSNYDPDKLRIICSFVLAVSHILPAVGAVWRGGFLLWIYIVVQKFMLCAILIFQVCNWTDCGLLICVGMVVWSASRFHKLITSHVFSVPN